MPWLLLTHPAALVAFWWLPGWAARRDAARFNAAPADDDLHVTFHRQRLLERLGIFAGLALVASLPCMGSWWAYVVSCLGLLAAAAGMWAYRFNRLLNIARNLPYVGPDYVSPDARAAFFPDRFIWAKAVAAIPPGPWNDAELHRERAAYAAAELRTLLRVALGAGVAVYALSLGVVYWCRV